MIESDLQVTETNLQAAHVPSPLWGEGRVRGEYRVPAALLLTLLLTACQSGSNPGTPPPPPTASLQTLTVSPAPAYLAVGDTQLLVATGKLSDGRPAPVLSGLTWQSSDPSAVTVDPTGLATAVGPGTATIIATHAAGVSGTATLVSRRVTTASASALPKAVQVDITTAYLRLSGLTPGGFYTPSLTELDDDVDLAVYSDASLGDGAKLCSSENVDRTPESCVAPANGKGELYVVVDGSWTEAGAHFQLTAPPAAPTAVAASLSPPQLPFAAAVDTRAVVYRLTGLAPGARYAVRISGLTDDADLEVYADAYLYTSLCASYASGKVDDACAAAANAAGELYVEVDGESTANGASFTLAVTPAG